MTAPENKDGDSTKNKPEYSFKNEKLDGLVSYARDNVRDTVAYIVLIVGLILLFFQPLYGGMLIGLVVGLFFTSEINALFRNVNEIIAKEGMVRSLILGALILAVFISAPAILIGIAVAVALRLLIEPVLTK